MSNDIGIYPLGRMLLVEMQEAEASTPSGLYLPQEAIARETQDQKEAIVLVLGDGNMGGEIKHTFSTKVGDRVILGRFQGSKLKKNGKEYNLVNEGDVLAILKA